MSLGSTKNQQPTRPSSENYRKHNQTSDLDNNKTLVIVQYSCCSEDCLLSLFETCASLSQVCIAPTSTQPYNLISITTLESINLETPFLDAMISTII